MTPGSRRHVQGMIQYLPAHGDTDAVLSWRRSRLVAAGFDAARADELTSAHADVHELLSLVARGCPPELAARILAPIADVGRSA